MRTDRCTGAPRRRRQRVEVGVAAVTALLTSACGGGESGKSSAENPPAAVASSASSSPAPSSAPSSPGGGKGTTVIANESEFAIALSTTTFTPGTYTFVAKNTGRAPHALEIDGPGVSDRATTTVSGGESSAVTVRLQKGTYELYCPVDGHKASGMELHITVP